LGWVTLVENISKKKKNSARELMKIQVEVLGCVKFMELVDWLYKSLGKGLWNL